MSDSFAESTVESAALAWLESIGWRVAHGLDIAPDMPAAERADYTEVGLTQRMHDALARFNLEASAEALHGALGNLRRRQGWYRGMAAMSTSSEW